LGYEKKILDGTASQEKPYKSTIVAVGHHAPVQPAEKVRRLALSRELKGPAASYSGPKQSLTSGRKNRGFERLAEGEFVRGFGEDVSVRFEPAVLFHDYRRAIP